MMGMEKAASGAGAKGKGAERREGKKEKDNRKEGPATGRLKYILENSCYSLSGVLEEQPEQSVLV